MAVKLYDTLLLTPRRGPQPSALADASPRTAQPAQVRAARCERESEAAATPATYLPRSGPPLRVGLVTPNLVLGGAEFWILGLLKYCDPRDIAWSGVVITNPDLCDETMCRQAARHAPLYSGPQENSDRTFAPETTCVRRFRTLREAVARLCRGSGVIVVWGVANFGEHLEGHDFSGQIVLVSHGACDWTETVVKSNAPIANWRVGVSAAAAAAFRSADAVVIHNGGDHERCQITRQRREVRREWGARGDEKLVGYVGRFSWEKNPAAAALAVRELGPPFRAVYIGSGWKRDDVQAYVRGLAPRTIFLPAHMDIGNALNALDVLVLASPSEGFSLILTEAWLCGVPTVATRVGAVPELEAQHGQLVVAVPTNPTGEQLAAAVRDALGAESAAIVNRAKKVAWSDYTAKAMAHRWTRFLLGAARG